MSFVRCAKYHKSSWNGAVELHISVDLLCGTTTAELQKSVDLLSGTISAELHNSVDLLWSTTNAELHNSVNLLCGTTAAEPNNPVWCIQQESHTFCKDSDEPCWKMWVEGLIQSKINGKLLKDERFGRFSKHRTIGDLQQTIAMCTLYKDWANVWKMSAEGTRITKWVSASKWGKM